jgi:hypothetical protein
MTTSDYLLDIALIAIILLQLRPRALGVVTLLLPVGIVVWAASKYLKGIPTAGNDLVLVIGATIVGLVIGAGVAWLTKVYRDAGGKVVARATLGAAALWIIGMGARMAFQIYATNGGGAEIARFSVENNLTIDAWTSAILLMALAQVLVRTLMVFWRGQSLPRTRAVSNTGR